MQIISSRVGGGHQSVAQALAEAFADLDRDDLDVAVDDLYLELARFPASRFPWLYATMTRSHPRLWRFVFNVTNRPPKRGRFELLGESIGGPRLARALAERRPDVVISVLPGVNGFIARSLARHGSPSPVEVVVTDWADIHLGWLSARVSHYNVPTEAAAETCRAAGIPASSVSVVGFPVRRQFAQARPSDAGRRAARERLGLPIGRFIVLAMVGTEGSAGALAHLAALGWADLDAEIVVVCGRNERLRRRVAALGHPGHVRALGFVEGIADLMTASDLLVTKPGGVTLAEAFCCGVPVLAFDPLPGQEERNARYVVSKGAAMLATGPNGLVELATDLRRSPTRRASLAASGTALARPSAATDTALAIISRGGSSSRMT